MENKQAYLDTLASLAQFPFPVYSENQKYWALKAKQLKAFGNFKAVASRSAYVAYKAHTADSLCAAVQNKIHQNNVCR